MSDLHSAINNQESLRFSASTLKCKHVSFRERLLSKAIVNFVYLVLRQEAEAWQMLSHELQAIFPLPRQVRLQDGFEVSALDRQEITVIFADDRGAAELVLQERELTDERSLFQCCDIVAPRIWWLLNCQDLFDAYSLPR